MPASHAENRIVDGIFSREDLLGEKIGRGMLSLDSRNVPREWLNRSEADGGLAV